MNFNDDINPFGEINEKSDEDTLDQYMNEIKIEAVEQEEFNYNAVRNNYLPIDKRKDDIGGLKIEEEELEEEINVITQEELHKMMNFSKLDDKEKNTFNIPKKPIDKKNNEENDQEEEEEAEPEYNEQELDFINALKNSTVLFANTEEESKIEKKIQESSEDEGKLCDDNEVADHMNIEEKLKKTKGMES